MSARTLAANLIQSVLVDQRPFDANAPEVLAAPKDQISELRYYVFNVLRHFYWLEAIASLLIKKPLKKKDYDLYGILLIGLFELWQASKPDYAILNESVKAVPKKKKWAQGLINATLREFQREKERLTTKVKKDLQARHNCPSWLIDIITAQWPEHAEDIFAFSQSHPPMTLRAHAGQNSAKDYCHILEQNGIRADLHAHSPQAVLLKTPVDVEHLPGFKEGKVSVQDLSAQLMPQLLKIESGLHVLDACSAPGGKCAHLLELEPSLEVIALEVNPNRSKKLEQTLSRLNLKATTVTADARHPAAWWDGKLFDRIVLDAPCTGSGVIRRHPEIKLHSSISSINKATELQAELLDALWPLLKHNGILVYITCSIFQEENVDQIQRFLARQPDCFASPLDYDWGIPQSVGRQILPNVIMDGFYYAQLIKI